MIGGKIAKNVRPSAESPTGLLRTNAAVASGAQGPKLRTLSRSHRPVFAPMVPRLKQPTGIRRMATRFRQH